jgi:hypothetical protein
VLSVQATSSSTGPSGRRYEPIVQIGRGGMAEVLLTIVDAGGGMRRLEVLKRIWPELTQDPDFVAMFLDEARLSLRLNHANVVQTYEVLSEGGQLAIAMEYLDGQPLTRVLNRLVRGPHGLSLALRLRIVMNILAGLEHAHTLTDLDGTPLEVVHRDVSPPNVFVTYDGRVKLVDFGVAKTLSASHHTRPGAIKGKLAYMAPEQLQCETVDRRADLFAVGVMLWEMLAARRMWLGKSEVDIVGHLAAGRPMPALPADAQLPPGLDAICARALERDPDRRYQTAAELEMDLEGVLVGSADSHARNLGQVVSLAFAAERAERQAVIERSLRGGGRSTAPVLLQAVAPAAPRELTGIDVSLSDLQTGTAGFVIRSAPAPRELRWWRAVALVSLAVASFTAIVLLGTWHSAPTGGRPEPGVAAAAKPSAWTTIPIPAAGTRPVPRIGQAHPVVASGSSRAGGDSDRRRHRRGPSTDEDATLPPSSREPGQR